MVFITEQKEKGTSEKSPPHKSTSARRGSLRAAAGHLPRALRRLPREDPHAEVGEEVRVGVGPVEFKVYETH